MLGTIDKADLQATQTDIHLNSYCLYIFFFLKQVASPFLPYKSPWAKGLNGGLKDETREQTDTLQDATYCLKVDSQSGD